MLRRLNRVLTVLVAAVFVTAGWSVAARTEWAATRDYLGAGPGFDHWADPLLAVTGMFLVAVGASRLVESAWRALFPRRTRTRPSRPKSSPPTPDPALPEAA